MNTWSLSHAPSNILSWFVRESYLERRAISLWPISNKVVVISAQTKLSDDLEILAESVDELKAIVEDTEGGPPASKSEQLTRLPKHSDCIYYNSNKYHVHGEFCIGILGELDTKLLIFNQTLIATMAMLGHFCYMLWVIANIHTAVTRLTPVLTSVKKEEMPFMTVCNFYQL